MKKQDSPTHELPSFARYLNNVFDFRAAVATMADARVAPEISPSAVVARQIISSPVKAVLAVEWLAAWRERRHSKLVRRYHLPGIEVARQLRVSVLKLPPRIRAPDSPAPNAHTI